jgi:hypothetical protein
MCVRAQEEGKSSSKDEMEARLKDVGSTTKGRLDAAINSPEVAKQMAQEAAQKRIEELKARAREPPKPRTQAITEDVVAPSFLQQTAEDAVLSLLALPAQEYIQKYKY